MVRLAALVNGIILSDALLLREEMSSSEHQMQDLSAFVSSRVSASLGTAASALLNPDVSMDTDIGQVVKTASDQMDLGTATKLIQKSSLPDDVSNLVQKVQSNSFGEFSEESLGKARRALNELVEKAWLALDDKIFTCVGFREMNRENHAQVTRDTLRLIEQINDLERIEAEAIDGIAQQDQDILDVEASIEKATNLYNLEYDDNKASLTKRQNDLDVFQFVLQFTKCPDATSLSQTGMKVCEYHSGPHAGHKTILFSDKITAHKYEKMLTPAARSTIDRLLRSVEHPTSLLQQPSKESTTPQPKPSAPVKGQDGKCSGDDVNCQVTCGPDPPDCALLHDKLSLMWGEHKDKVDELTMQMMTSQLEFEDLKENLNGQIRLLTTAKTRLSQLLAEARSNMAGDRGELTEKYNQRDDLDHQYGEYMRSCQRHLAWIMGQDICAIKTVRNAVLENSTECPTDQIQDCVMDAWIPSQCSTSCDDSCDSSSPFKCGGWQQMNRQTIVLNDECGTKCPLSTKLKRCGQYKCPIDCHMSSWSGWSKCTAECEGGLQSQTRNIMTKPKNGGTQCNTVEDTRGCNTVSCDRNCWLQRWTDWSPCSVACGGGFQEKFRHVLRPIRGQGKCPGAKNSARLRNQQCNQQDCNGDEICIAKQDLVIAIDGSGSVREQGFKVLTSYVGTLLARYQTEYYGDAAVKIGIVLFGNGVIMPDGKTVSPAISAHALSFDMAAVTATVEGLPFKKGFTNMAQAFAMAESMFIKGRRQEAQQSVMMITDGKPSFSFMTNEMVQQLDDKGILRYFLVISETSLNDESMKNMKVWASQPWETNIVHVNGGLLMLEADPDLWAEKAITKFCPMSISPASEEWETTVYGYQHVKDGAFCGQKKRKNVLSKTTAGAEQCAALASGAGAESFLLGTWSRRGWCMAGTIAVSADQYKEWLSPTGKVQPKCAESDGWHSSLLFDFYAMQPVGMQQEQSA